MHAFSNRLINETSPYLLQHAHNPVDWFPWGDEAFEKALKEDKPILVSIGYAACHWCHVMERESFENEETAAMMNNYFVNIKIDREERPDIDHIYMDAVQAMTGSGGWPLNVFLTPEKKPFFGGTYFPPVNAYNRKSWKEILKAVHNAYKERKGEIDTQADNLTQHLQKGSAFSYLKPYDGNSLPHENKMEILIKNLLQTADQQWGGFGNAPKFPQTFSIQLLLRHYHFTKDQAALEHAMLSLEKMIQGGIYDQLVGGFARYSTDEKWLAPHFEKMLYDNALLVSVLSEAYQVTQHPLFVEVIEQTMDFLTSELLSTEGGFYSALDADSEGVEGKFYTWEKAEIENILEADARLFCDYYGITDEGNWEHTNILWVKTSLEKLADEYQLSGSEIQTILNRAKATLISERNKRVRPQLDDKILLGWNALMNIACSKAFCATGNEKFRQMAIMNMNFLEKSFKTENGFWNHTFKNGISKYAAFLDDYAYLIHAFILLQEITGEVLYLEKASDITEAVWQNFGDEQSGLFFYTPRDQKDVIIRKIEVYDGATPSGNAVMAGNLNYLGAIFGKQHWKERAIRMTMQFEEVILRYPNSFGCWSIFYQQLVEGDVEIVFAGKKVDQGIFSVVNEFIPNKILQVSKAALSGYPLLKGKNFDNDSLLYLCRNYSCLPAVTDIQQLKMLLK